METKRDGFSSKGGFILACIGSAVGMGNIWRFPIMVSMWGGLTFLIPYFVFVILISQSGVIEEMAFGRAAKSGPVGAFGLATKRRFGKEGPGKAVGLIPVIGALMLAIGYTCVVGWIFKYTFMAFSGDMFAMGGDMNTIGGTFGATASGWGNNVWQLIGLAVAFAIAVFGISSGIEKANKIMMPVLFALFLGLAIYIATIPGAGEGYKYILTIKPEMFADPKLYIYAFGQAFFSLSIAGNGTVIYGSYLSDKEDVISAASRVALFDTVAALLAAFVIVPAMAAGGADLTSGGPGLMFIYLVNVMNIMPGGRVIEIIFYLCVLFAGVSSLINLYEVPIAFMQDNLKRGRVFSVLSVGIFGAAVALCIQGIVSGWMDFVSNVMCPLGAFLAAVFFTWVLDRAFVESEIGKGRTAGIPVWIYPMTKYLFCLMAIVALIGSLLLGGIG